MPLSFDLSLEELQEYEGTNPRPPDFDTYWDAALADMRAVDPQVEIIPASFQTSFAACSHLTFTGVGGARIHAKLLRPRQAQEPHPAILMFHGYSANSGNWTDKLGYVAAGFTVAVMDCRGQGGLSQDAGGVRGNTLQGHIIRGLDDEPQNLLFRHIFLDTAELANIVMAMPEVDAARVGATGGSQGGGLTLACAALEPRLKKIACSNPFLSDYQRVWEMDLDQDAYEELRLYFRRFDPRHERETAVFTRLGYIDVQHLCPRIAAEVLFATALRDTVCPPSTQFAAYNKIRAPKSMLVYPDFGHEELPGLNDHVFTFMLDL
ncbi:MAG: acetylxylan esterase [Candidatus Promineifilaceae bacterium]|nr:acetylxylan esterase [Candidatus Promineifilaceae bacterium]